MPNPSGLCKCGCGQRTTLAKQSIRSKGHVIGQPVDWIRGHNARKYEEGFEIRDCGYETPCHVWTGRIDVNGYGWTRRNGIDEQAHRALWKATFGPLPPGHATVLHHKCENPPCVNLDHLQPSTVHEHRLAHSPMTAESAALIRASDKSQAALAREFGCSTALIYLIRRDRAWISSQPEYPGQKQHPSGKR